MPDDKEYLLKVMQAWVDLKIKVVSLVLIGNGVALTTAVAFLKDKGPQGEGLFPLRISALGVLLGGAALWLAYAYSNNYLTVQFEGEPKRAKITKPKKAVPKSMVIFGREVKTPEWAVNFEAKEKTLAFANSWFKFLIICSVMCLVLSIGYLTGFTEGQLECMAKHLTTGGSCY